MTAVLPPPEIDAPSSVEPLHLHEGTPAKIPYGRAFSALAGICGSERTAAAVAQQLAQAYGLEPRQVTLLGPHDAGWVRFKRRARRWAQGADSDGRAWFDDRWLMALLCGAALLPMLLAWALMGAEMFELAVMLPLMLASLTLALGSGAMALVGYQRPQFRRFDRRLRRELAKGRWLVLLHDVPAQRQEGLVSFVCSRSQRWCAVSPATAWL